MYFMNDSTRRPAAYPIAVLAGPASHAARLSRGIDAFHALVENSTCTYLSVQFYNN